MPHSVLSNLGISVHCLVGSVCLNTWVYYCSRYMKVKNLLVSIRIDAAYNKTYNITCATSKDSDQPAHLQNLIRIFADCMCLLQPPDYSKRNKREPLPFCVDVLVYMSLCWSHMSYCRSCHALAQIIKGSARATFG